MTQSPIDTSSTPNSDPVGAGPSGTVGHTEPTQSAVPPLAQALGEGAARTAAGLVVGLLMAKARAAGLGRVICLAGAAVTWWQV